MNEVTAQPSSPPELTTPRDGHPSVLPPVGVPGADTTDAVGRDLYCMGCGYNLRGQRREGHCSECGESVERAYFTGRAVLRGPAAIKTGRYGVIAVLVSVCLTLTSVLTLFSGSIREEVAFVLFGLWVGLEHVLWLAGAVWLGKLAVGGSYAGLKPIALIVTTTLNACFMGLFLLTLLVGIGGRSGDDLLIPIFVLTGLVFATRGPAVYFIQRWLATFCYDIGRPDLARHLRRTGWAIVVVIAGMVSSYVIAWSVGPFGVVTGEYIAMGCLWLIGAGYIALAVLCIIAIVHLSRLLAALNHLVKTPSAPAAFAEGQTPASATPR